MYDQLQRLLPRYIRVNGLSFNKCSEDVMNFHVISLQRLLGIDAVYAVKWVPGFVAVPGYISLAALNSHPDYFPMDISSGFVVFQSGIDSPSDSFEANSGTENTTSSSTTAPNTVLDLCCCPGGKYMTIADQMQGGSDRVLVGVDVSAGRMQTCKALVGKNLGPLYNTGSRRRVTEGDEEKDSNVQVESSQCDAIMRPRLLLFTADGTTFGRDRPGELVFDSAVHFSRDMLLYGPDVTTNARPTALGGGAEEDVGICVGSGRKRKNKSYRGRERQRLRAATEALLGAAVPPDSNTTTSTISSGGGDTLDDESETSDRPMDLGNRTTVSRVNAFSGFDVVFVDAECSHDGSYRHLAAIETSSSTSASASASVIRTSTSSCSNTSACTGASDEHSTRPSFAVGGTGDSELAGDGGEPQDQSSTTTGRVYVKRDRYSTRDEGTIVDLQRRLIEHGFDLLRPGGTLMYSTCSLSARQNFGVVRHILDTRPDAKLVPIECADVDSHTTTICTTPCDDPLMATGAEVFEALSLRDDELALFLNDKSSSRYNTEGSSSSRSSREGDEEEGGALRRASQALCKYIASMSHAPSSCFQRGHSKQEDTKNDTTGDVTDVCAPISGTVLFQRQCGTSGLFAAKIVKSLG